MKKFVFDPPKPQADDDIPIWVQSFGASGYKGTHRVTKGFARKINEYSRQRGLEYKLVPSCGDKL